MNKIVKFFSTVIFMVMVISVSLSVNAYTNDDVIAYISKAHTANGRTVQLDQTQRENLKNYLQNNPVTEAEANDIIAKLDAAKAKIDNSGATNLSELSESIKSEVVSLVKSAGAIAGLDVEVDTVNEIVTIKDKNGNVVVSATSYAQFNKDAAKATTNTNTGKKASTQATSGSVKTQSATTNSGKKLVYTGNDYTSAIKMIVAIVAVAISGILVKKYAK